MEQANQLIVEQRFTVVQDRLDPCQAVRRKFTVRGDCRHDANQLPASERNEYAASGDRPGPLLRGKVIKQLRQRNRERDPEHF